MAYPLAGLLWDVDGTLAETERHGHRRAFNAAFRDLGLDVEWDWTTYSDLLSVSGGRERILAYFRSRGDAHPSTDLVEALVQSKARHYARLLREGHLPLREGVERLIDEAAAAGLEQAIVTTSGRYAVEALANAALPALRRAFTCWICGEDVERKKPDPEAYLKALAQLGHPPQAVLAIEDSANGLAASEAAGVGCLVTLGDASETEPLSRFDGARAVVDGLGDGQRAVRVLDGPPCPEGKITLSYLRRLAATR
jgi:HAD superfamily hydrolase (TIGR01509 family)